MRKLAVILAVLMLVCTIIPQAAATNDSLEVIVTMNRRIFQPGSQVKITVHVFDKGTYVSADDITVTVGYYPFAEEVNVIEIHTGFYEGSYTIKEDETTLSISSTVSRGNDIDTGYTFVDLTGEAQVADFSVDLMLDDPADYQAEPGDAVEMTVTVKENGTLVDPDTFKLDVDGSSQSYTQTGTGTYKATYNIPPALNKGGQYDIEAYAEKDNMEDNDYDTFYVQFFMVCYHNITKTNTSSTFDIYVSDMNGKVVAGATVSISYDDDDNDNSPMATIQGTTDRQGKTRFTISYQVTGYLDVEGTVTHGSKSQEFDGTIWVSNGYDFEPEEPRDRGFDVVDQGDWDDIYGPGNTVTKQYIAYMDGAPWANKEVYYYIIEGTSPSYDVVGQGTINTDSNGQFSLTFTAPQEMVIIDFETGRPKTTEDFFYDEDDDLVYEDDMEYIFIWEETDLPVLDWDEGVSVSVDSLALGSPTTVRVNAANIPSDARVITAWFVGSADNYWEIVSSLSFDFDWQCWSGMPGGSLSKSDVEYHGELLLPEYLPQNEYYTIIAGWTTSEGRPHLNYVVLQPGESGGVGTTSDDDGVGGDTLLLILLLVVVLVILVVAIKVIGKPKKKTPM